MAGATSPSALARKSFGTGVLTRALRRGVSLGVVAVSVVLYAMVLIAGSHEDLHAYLGAAGDLVAGKPLYAAFLHHPFPDATLRPAYIYPPVFALLMVPLRWLPPAIATWAFALAMQAALALAMLVMARFMRPGWPAMWVGLVLTLTFFPLLVDQAQGQVNLLLLVLTVLGIVGILRGHGGAGAWLGAAAAIKLTPGLLIGWLLWTRRWTAAACLVLGFAAVTGVGAAIRPGDTVTFFARVLPAVARGTAFYSNQSVAGVVGRLFTANAYTTPWLDLPAAWALVAGVDLALVVFWALTARHLDDTGIAFSFLPLLPLLSAVTWEHHLVVLLPVVWLIIVRLGQRGWPVRPTMLLGLAVGFLSLLPRWHPGPPFGSAAFRGAQTGDPLVVLTANALFCGTLILVLASRWLLPPAQAESRSSSS